jgi:hypothetical protein
MTAIDFEGVAQSQLVQAPTRGTGAHLWRQLTRCAAAVARELSRCARRPGDHTLPLPDQSNRQFRHDILRIEARRLL